MRILSSACIFALLVQGSFGATMTVSEEMNTEGIQRLVYEFTNFTSGSFNAAQILSRLSSLEENVQKSKLEAEASFRKDSDKLRQLGALYIQISEIKVKLIELEQKLGGLSAGMNNLGLASSVPRQPSWATLYSSRGHSGRTIELDFRNCSVHEDCCLNLQGLVNDAQSINTHGTCVRMYEGRDCHGMSREFFAGSRVCHADFGQFRDKFSSGKPCSTTGSYTRCVPD